MRKTSQDGTDSTSVTSGLDNELKKPGTSANKIKKSSIKRKVANFSHDSDDAIIEPLLQTEKENSIIANKSAKYLLNKSKTDCLYEKDTKALENPKVSTPVSISNNVTNNIVSEKQSSPSFISETAPLYNHMNTNVFSGYDLKKEKTTTSSSILVEIDGCKAVSHGPSPLIFTTAKIHTDSKTKVMEPQVTPMPILSTIEGNVVKAGVIYDDDKKYNILHTNKKDVSKNVDTKSDFKLEPANFKDLSHVKVLPNEKFSDTSQIKNQQNTKKELDCQEPFEKSSKLFSKDQKVSLKTCNDSVDPKSLIAKVTSEDKVLAKAKPIIATATCKANGALISDNTKKIIGTETKSITSDKNYITDKTKGLSENDRTNEKINSNKNTHPPATSSMPQASKINNKSNLNTVQNDKIDSIKSFSTSSKKLQRQKNAAVEEVKEINYKELNNITTVKNNPISDKVVSTTLGFKSDNATINKITTPITTKSTTPIVTSGVQSKSSNLSTTNPSTCKSSVTTGISAPISSKPVTDAVKTKPATTKIPELSIKSSTKAPAPANITSIVTTTSSSSKTSTASTAKSTKITDSRSSAKQDLTSLSALPSKITNTEPTTTSSAASSLPLYIVSTSKTKIGSSSIPSISTATKKGLDQKPTPDVITTNGKSGKLLMSSQSNQSSSKPKITNINLVKKDDRA